MSRRSEMLATLADIESKPSTPKRETAKRNLRAGIERIDAHAARTRADSRPAREMTTYDREQLMKLVDDPGRSDAVRVRACEILDNGGEKLTVRDVHFLQRVEVDD